MPKLVLNLVLPALAIVLSALAQLALTTFWPGIQFVHSDFVSVDSYIVLLLALVLSFVAGRLARRSVPTVAGAAVAAIAPMAWFALIFRGSFLIGGSISWFQPLTIIMLSSAIAPLIGVALGWALSWPKLWRPKGV